MSAASVSTEAMTGVRACSLPDSCGVQEPGAGWVDQLADVITRRITEKVFPARRGSVPFHTSLRRFVRTNVLSVANAHDAVCPPCEEPQRSVQEFGVWVAEQGFPLTAVQNAYWTGTRQLIDVWGEMGWPGLAPLRHVDDDPTNVPGHVVSQVLDVLSPGEALHLFTRIADEPEAARIVMAACGSVPLAIRIAACRLAARPTWRIRR